jgi:hypothetical protein
MYNKVFIFSKRNYEIKQLESLSENDLTKLIKTDNSNCKIYSISEYQNLINSFNHLDNLVWTIFK